MVFVPACYILCMQLRIHVFSVVPERNVITYVLHVINVTYIRL